MKKELRPALVKLTDIIYSMDIVGVRHGVTVYYWIVKEFDPSKQDEINSVCEEYNLEWDVQPAPLVLTSGKRTSTKNKLNRLSNKRRPLVEGALPHQIARAKIIVHEKKKKRKYQI